MKKEYLDTRQDKLQTRARILMRSFFINTIFVLFFWVLSFIPGILFFGALLTGVPGAWFYYLMMCGLALWELIAVVFYLVPSLATFWESKKQL